MVQVSKTYGSSCHPFGSEDKATWSFLIRERKRRHFAKGEQSVRVSHRMYSALYRRMVAGSSSTHQSFISLRGKKLNCLRYHTSVLNFHLKTQMGVLLA